MKSLRELAEEWEDCQRTAHWALRDDPDAKEPHTCACLGATAKARGELFEAIEIAEAYKRVAAAALAFEMEEWPHPVEWPDGPAYAMDDLTRAIKSMSQEARVEICPCPECVKEREEPG